MSNYKVHLTTKEVSVSSDYGTITAERSEHLESQVSQLRDKLAANEKESQRLTVLLNPAPKDKVQHHQADEKPVSKSYFKK
jgi:hypothetical protein